MDHLAQRHPNKKPPTPNPLITTIRVGVCTWCKVSLAEAPEIDPACSAVTAIECGHAMHHACFYELTTIQSGEKKGERCHQACPDPNCKGIAVPGRPRLPLKLVVTEVPKYQTEKIKKLEAELAIKDAIVRRIRSIVADKPLVRSSLEKWLAEYDTLTAMELESEMEPKKTKANTKLSPVLATKSIELVESMDNTDEAGKSVVTLSTSTHSPARKRKNGQAMVKPILKKPKVMLSRTLVKPPPEEEEPMLEEGNIEFSYDTIVNSVVNKLVSVDNKEKSVVEAMEAVLHTNQTISDTRNVVNESVIVTKELLDLCEKLEKGSLTMEKAKEEAVSTSSTNTSNTQTTDQSQSSSKTTTQQSDAEATNRVSNKKPDSANDKTKSSQKPVNPKLSESGDRRLFGRGSSHSNMTHDRRNRHDLMSSKRSDRYDGTLEKKEIDPTRVDKKREIRVKTFDGKERMYVLPVDRNNWATYMTKYKGVMDTRLYGDDEINFQHTMNLLPLARYRMDGTGVMVFAINSFVFLGDQLAYALVKEAVVHNKSVKLQVSANNPYLAPSISTAKILATLRKHKIVPTRLILSVGNCELHERKEFEMVERELEEFLYQLYDLGVRHVLMLPTMLNEDSDPNRRRLRQFLRYGIPNVFPGEYVYLRTLEQVVDRVPPREKHKETYYLTEQQHWEMLADLAIETTSEREVQYDDCPTRAMAVAKFRKGQQLNKEEDLRYRRELEEKKKGRIARRE